MPTRFCRYSVTPPPPTTVFMFIVVPGPEPGWPQQPSSDQQPGSAASSLHGRFRERGRGCGGGGQQAGAAGGHGGEAARAGAGRHHEPQLPQLAAADDEGQLRGAGDQPPGQPGPAAPGAGAADLVTSQHLTRGSRAVPVSQWLSWQSIWMFCIFY